VARARQARLDVDLAGDARRPRPQQHHPRAQRHRFGHVVGHEDDGLVSLLPDVDELRLQVVARLGIERAEGLVHEQDVGLERERARQRHPLLHAARQLMHVRAREAGHLDQRQVLLRAFVAHAPRHAQLLQAEGDVLGDVEPREERRILEHDAAIVAGPAYRPIAYQDGAGVGPLEPGDEVEERGLAAAGRADQADQLAARHVQAHVLDGRGGATGRGAEALGDMAYVDHGRA
jgi:hypothetical protein